MVVPDFFVGNGEWGMGNGEGCACRGKLENWKIGEWLIGESETIGGGGNG
jgi:hypothetical protein